MIGMSSRGLGLALLVLGGAAFAGFGVGADGTESGSGETSAETGRRGGGSVAEQARGDDETESGPGIGSIVVRVYQGATEKDVVPGAVVEVLGLPPAEIEGLEIGSQSSSLLLGKLRRTGPRYVADERGEVRLNLPKAKLWLHAAKGTAHAIRYLGSPDEAQDWGPEIQLHLEDYLPIKATVVGPDRTPQSGLQVELSIAGERGAMLRQLTVTDANGVAAFPMALSSGRKKLATSCSLTAGVADTAQPKAILARPELTGAVAELTAELVVGKTSSCQVTAKLCDGSDLFGAATLRLLAEDTDPPQWSEFTHLYRYASIPVRNARATLRYLTPGKRYAVELRSRMVGRLTKVFTAPPAGQTSELVMGFSPYTAGYTLRVLESKQQEPSTAELHCTIRGLSGGTQRRVVKVSKEGLVFIELFPDSESEAGKVELELVAQKPNSDVILQGAVVSAALAANGTIIDLGTCTLKPPPLLAGGYATASDGSFCPGAEVRIEPAQPENEHLPRDMPPKITADHEGRWEFYGFFDPGEFMATAKALGGQWGLAKRFPSRRLDVMLKVGPVASLSGTITTLKANVAGALHMTLEHATDSRLNPRLELHETSMPTQAKLTATHFRPGPHRIRVCSKFDGRLLYQESSLEIPEDGTVIHDITLPHVFHSIKLKVQDREGRAIPNAAVDCLDLVRDEDDNPRTVLSDKNGEVVVHTTRDRHRVRIVAEGYFTLHQVEIPKDSTFVLERRHLVTVRSKGLRALNDSVNIHLELTETPEHPGVRKRPITHYLRFRRGFLEFARKPQLRGLRVKAHLHRPDGFGRVMLPEQVIQISGKTGDVTVEVEWPGESIEKALADLSIAR